MHPLDADANQCRQAAAFSAELTFKGKFGTWKFEGE